MKYFLMVVGIAGGMLISCERHEFDGPNGTRQLHEHGSHAAGHDTQGADAHGEKDATQKAH